MAPILVTSPGCGGLTTASRPRFHLRSNGQVPIPTPYRDHSNLRCEFPPRCQSVFKLIAAQDRSQSGFDLTGGHLDGLADTPRPCISFGGNARSVLQLSGELSPASIAVAGECSPAVRDSSLSQLVTVLKRSDDVGDPRVGAQLLEGFWQRKSPVRIFVNSAG